MAKTGRKGQKPRGVRKDDLERKRDERAKRAALRKERDAKNFYSLEDDENYVSFYNQLQAIGLKIKDIPGDGNCLFRALADQLEGDHNRHRELRRNTVHFMRENSVDFEPFFDGESTFVEYLNELEKDGTFAGNDAIVAFSKHNNVDVIIHQYNSPKFVIRAPANSEKVELHLAYHNWEHYSSVRQLSDVSVGPAYLQHNRQHSRQQAPKIQGKAKDKLASKIKDVSTCASENITEEELLVMKSTSCQDTVFVRKSLNDNHGDVDSTIAYLLQLMALDDVRDQSQDAHVTACLKDDACASANNSCKCGEQMQDKNTETGRNSQTEKKQKMHLSNRQRKELAKQEKKKRREETLRTQSASGKKDLETNDEKDTDLGLVAI